MKLYKYVTIPGLLLGFSMVTGCTDNAPGNKSTDQTRNTEQKQASTNEEKPKSVGVLGHFAGQVDRARQAKQMQEEADRKREEMEKSAFE